MPESLTKEKIIELLKEISDLQIHADPLNSSDLAGIGTTKKSGTLLTRKELEELVEKQDNINIYSFHSSGINNVGNHSSN
ncbi:hypothetical protein [Pseudomonas sp. P8_241]|uniref:hypothetical protein n=1 Tax=Pseudomonas sp. P8_241 TaxID=3043445 RepID=UPI002A363CAA|nr:hypothetical protein [Pseudomonas sp. P8_241]WPN47863.1 hypothetical protein QMK58_04095 [Pseudomonas sp. P8_241]